MASSSQVTPDTLITIKVNVDGTPRRFKLPLRDVGVNVFESKVGWTTPRYPPSVDRLVLGVTDNILDSCDMP